MGNPVDGRPAVVAATANLCEFPGGYLSDQQMLILMTERVTAVAQRVRQRIDHLSKVDEVAPNQLWELSYEFDKHVWQFRGHMH